MELSHLAGEDKVWIEEQTSIIASIFPTVYIQSKIMSQCRPDRTEHGRVARMRPGGNLCPAARKKGIALLHGNCQVPPLSVFLFAIIANICSFKAFAGADTVLTEVFKFWRDQVTQEGIFVRHIVTPCDEKGRRKLATTSSIG